MAAAVREATGLQTAVDTAFFSADVVTIDGAATGPVHLTLGRRHRWVRRALAPDPSPRAAVRLALVVVARLRARGRLGPAAAQAATYRLLALAYAAT